MKRKRNRKSQNTQLQVQASLDVNRNSFDTLAHWMFARQERIGQTVDALDREKTRAKARFEFLNNDHFCGIVRSFAINVIGTGPRLVFSVDHLIPDRNDDALNRKARNICGEVERSFHEWINKFGYFAEQYAGMISMILDGEMLGVWNYNPNTKKCPFVYRSIDISRLANPNNKPDTVYMQGGIFYDSWGDPESYCLLELPDNPNQSYDYGKYQLVDAERVCHVYISEFSEQTRGISMAAQSLQRLGRLRDFEEATLEGAKNASSMLGFIKTTQGYMVPQGVRDAYMGQQWQAGSTTKINRNEILYLPPTAEYQHVESKPSNVDLNDYVNNALTALAHPFGMPKNQATNTSDDYNFSSAKLDLLNSMRFVEYVRKLINHKMNDQCFQVFWNSQRPRFLERYSHDGIEYIPESDDLNIKWRYPLPPEIEPWKREDMFKVMLENKTASVKDVLELRGSDITWYDLIDQLETENAYRGEMGSAITEIDSPVTTQSEAEQPSEDAIGSGQSLQSTALNGAQVTAAVDIVIKVTTGELPAETAINMLMEFFQLSEQVARKMIAPAKSFSSQQTLTPA